MTFDTKLNVDHDDDTLILKLEFIQKYLKSQDCDCGCPKQI